MAYAYDPFNQLVRRTFDADGAGSGAATDTIYSNESGQVALQFNGASASNLSHRYLWGAAVDQLLADEQVSSLSSAGSVLWPLADQVGTIRDIASHNSTTHATTIANHRVYDAFGNLTSETNSAVDELFGFTGRLFDEATGLQNNLNRWYDPKSGRWISEDPIGFAAHDPNLYRYVENDPLSHTDPSGLDKRLTSAGIHLGIEFDVWDEQGNHVGVMSADYGDYGWRTGRGSSSTGITNSSGSSCSLSNSHRSYSSSFGIGQSGELIIGIMKGQTLSARAPKRDSYYKVQSKNEDRQLLEYVARSAGMTPAQLISAVSSGQNRFKAYGRWYQYGVLTNNCRSFANWTFYGLFK